jgi:superfamily I DNA and/or RNA helicase
MNGMDEEAIVKFVNLQIECINKEQENENIQIKEQQTKYSQQQLKKRGVILSNLQNSALKSGFNGSTLMQFESNIQLVLNSLKFRVGDVVQVQQQSSKLTDCELYKVSGVVVKVNDKMIVVSIKEDLPNDLPDLFTIFKLANSISYKRMETALLRIIKTEPKDLQKVLFNLKSIEFVQIGELEFFNDNLNDSQKNAVKKSMEAQDIFLIHGPPGTGKTHTLVEVILQFVKLKKRILVCGPSNISVDNLVERLSHSKLDMIRLGHPARILNSVLHHSLDYRISTSSQGRIVNDVRQDLDTTFKSLKKKKGKERYKTYQEIKELRQELRQREKTVLATIIQNAQVVLTTLNGSASHILAKEDFDILIIDEASQALEAECWIPILKAKKLILAGDHFQLPPTIKSKSTEIAKPLSLTLFERVLKMHGDKVKGLLNVQYRMHDDILGFSSQHFYDNLVVSGGGVGDRLLSDLDDVEETEMTSVPIVFVDTAGAGFEETDDEDSKSNVGEAKCCLSHVKALLEVGVHQDEIAIISPYNGQIRILKEYFVEFPDIELGTVDGFQGREKEVVVFSMVRSNSDGEVGFLSEDRRLNVAITRSKRHLCIIGDSQTMNRNPFLREYVCYLEERAIVKFPDYMV